MSSIDDDPQLRELLIRLWGVIDRDAGILLVELPRHMSDDTLLSTAHGYGLIQFIRRNHCHVGGNLVLENGWNVAELYKPGRGPVWELVSRGLSEDVDDEIRLRVRLTNQGCDLAARFSRQSAANSIGQVAAVFDTAREAALQCNRVSHHILTKVESAEIATKELRWLFELLADAIEAAASAIPPVGSSLTAIANENEDLGQIERRANCHETARWHAVVMLQTLFGPGPRHTGILGRNPDGSHTIAQQPFEQSWPEIRRAILALGTFDGARLAVLVTRESERAKAAGGTYSPVHAISGKPFGESHGKKHHDLPSNLNLKERKVLDVIKENGPISGKALAKRIPIAESTLRRHFIPKLKAHGVKNDGDGYYVAPHGDT